MTKEYLDSVKKQFEYYRMLGDKTFGQLTDEQLFWQFNEESNSIGIIVKHLWGNMLSRWTDFFSTDGEKERRNREAEFENDIKDRAELIMKWTEGWTCLFQALDSINESNFNSIVYIRNQGYTVMEAINRQLAHYPYHIGQIVFLGKMVCNEQWVSLSIPREKSNDYNQEKFSKPKRKEHFTDEYIKKEE